MISDQSLLLSTIVLNDSVNLVAIQQGIKKLQWFKYLKVVFLEILNTLLCWVFANQVPYMLS